MRTRGAFPVLCLSMAGQQQLATTSCCNNAEFALRLRLILSELQLCWQMKDPKP